ncbi:transposase [Clostridium gasigenes]|uniref:transposase n=1 Tax=Clostridium gasigenes TaxID=94869 RepID=UPI003F49CA0C
MDTIGVSAESLIYYILEERRTTRGYVFDVTNDVKESRFSKGKCCPRCESDSVCRNGKYNGKQHYLFKSCKKTFMDFTHSPSYNRKKPLDKWITYTKCMVDGYTLQRCDQETEIILATSFYWRHKRY